MSFIIDVMLFALALIVIWKIHPYFKNLLEGNYFSYIISKKALERRNSNEYNNSGLDDEHEDIGLSKKKRTILDLKNIRNFIEHNKERVENIKLLLMKAGKREDSDFSNFIIYQFGMYSFLGIVGFFYVLIAYVNFPIPFWAIATASFPIGIIIGYQISLSNLKNEARERQEKINDGVPDLIDLLVICTESGLDINRALTRIAREIRNTNIELSNELTLTAVEMEMIPDFKQVFLNMENRTDSLQIKSLSKTLSQSIEYGSPLGELLKELAVEARQKKILLAEEKAARIPTYLTLPLMLFILPCLFIVMLGPAISEVMKSFSDV